MAQKILIADDEEDVKIVIQLFLESKGYEIATAYDGLDAIDRAREEKPDMIILDVMMPVIDGFEVCKRLKADAELKDIPVVMLSASAHAESRERGLEAGAIDYLVKPFEPDKLEKVVQKVLS